MIAFLSLFLHILVSPLKTHARLVAEIVTLPHQLNVVRADPCGLHGFRTHLSLDKDSPIDRPIQRLGQPAAQPILGGLHHGYCRM